MLYRLPFRLLALLLFAACAALLAFGLYLQHAQGIEPCPMCIMQRYALATCGLIGLLDGRNAQPLCCKAAARHPLDIRFWELR